MKAKHRSKARRLDIITTLPQPIIETILCLLPIKQAAKTSILSKEWRYKWTTIPKLEFRLYSGMYYVSQEKMARVIQQVLLLRQAPIHEFTLSMDADDSCGEIDQIIFHLSRNHPVKKLTLNLRDSDSYKLPLSLFSMHHLTELNLECCDLLHQPTFNGFGSLTSLSLFEVKMSKVTLLHLLSNCPLLKRFRLIFFDEHILGDEYPNILELFKCLPMIEHLNIWGCIDLLEFPDSVPQELSNLLIQLKYFRMGQIDFGSRFGLHFVFVLIKCSPNLKKIKLKVCEDEYHDEIEPSILEKYSDVWLEHLNELKIYYFRNSKLVVDFVKFILARSPNLKKVVLRVDKKEHWKMLKVLLRPLHASPVKFIVEILDKSYKWYWIRELNFLAN